jgi:CBS domain containing-hemolysin-like protein
VDETVSNLTDSDSDEQKQDNEANAPSREEQEVQLLKGVMKFGSIQVKQIMRPRPDVVALNADLSFEDAIKIIKESGYSRIPVYKQSLDNIIGVLFTKDLLAFLLNGTDKNWNQLIREAFFVPEGKKIAELLIEFQSKMIHLAVVIDEYGSTAGIVTLEDILEEIIGEIRDESDDKTEMEYIKLDDHTFIFEGKTMLNDVYKVMGIKNFPFDDIKGDVESIGGLVMELSGKMPKEKEELTYKNYRFEIMDIDKHRVKKVKLIHQPEEE